MGRLGDGHLRVGSRVSGIPSRAQQVAGGLVDRSVRGGLHRCACSGHEGAQSEFIFIHRARTEIRAELCATDYRWRIAHAQCLALGSDGLAARNLASLVRNCRGDRRSILRQGGTDHGHVFNGRGDRGSICSRESRKLVHGRWVRSGADWIWNLDRLEVRRMNPLL